MEIGTAIKHVRSDGSFVEGRIVARTFGRISYDIETDTGERIEGLLPQALRAVGLGVSACPAGFKSRRDR